MMEMGVRVYLPLHIEPIHPHGFDRRPKWHITPLFMGYLFGQWSAADDARPILRARGIGGIISDPTTGRPAPLPEGAIEELLAKTSARRVVDDPADDPALPIEPVERPHWQDITRLSGRERSDLLLRLFGREDVAA